MILRSRIVLPISQPPVENGAVVVSGNAIVAVGRWGDISQRFTGPVTDLGDSILLPGLINAHCHLDYTNMAGMIPPARLFADWIKAMLATKAAWSYSEYAESWIRGAHMLVDSGTTLVADIEAVPELLPQVWTTTPLRVFSFLELTCVKSGRSPDEVLRDAETLMTSVQAPRHSIQLSPHALYSTTPDLMKLAAANARKSGGLLTTHVAESEAEFEMYQYRRGPLFEWLKQQRDVSDCGGHSPVQQLDECGVLSPSFLAVHVNYLAAGDAELLTSRGSSVVHCPRSHAYFSHRGFPFEELAAAGVNICLGTDSLATVITSRKQPTRLSLFQEMQRFAELRRSVPGKTIVEMATINGAKALGLAGKFGELVADAHADMISIPFYGVAADAFDAVVHHQSNVSTSMIDGSWAIAPRG